MSSYKNYCSGSFLDSRKLIIIGLFAALSTAVIADDENASNPLSKVKNTDIRLDYFDLGDAGDRTEYTLDGAFMASDKLKIKYEANYWDTNTGGRSEQDWESFHLKGIYFPSEGKWGDTPYRTSVGLEWIKSFDNADIGIGSDADILSPFGGVALKMNDSLTLIPLVQHYTEYSGDEVDITAGRLIGLWSLADGYWWKLDARVPYDWNNHVIPASTEVQFGKMLGRSFGIYGEGLVGLGSDRSYDWGIGFGLRFVY
ncbi:MAG: hypothetical protein V7709_15670 [Halioglobus sp.]